MSGRVTCALSAGIAVLTVDNPPLNLLTVAVRQSLATHAAALAGNENCRVVLLAGAGGRAFSAGSDVREFPDTADGGVERAQMEHTTFSALTALPQPVIASLFGHVLGGGLELALCADFRIADQDTSLGLPEVTLGLLPCGGGTQRLPRLLGSARAKRLLFTGRPVTAQEAFEIGLVDQVVPMGEVHAAALQTCQQIAAYPAAAVEAIKHAVDRGLTEGVEAGLFLEERLGGPLFASPHARSARQRLLDRTRPDRESER